MKKGKAVTRRRAAATAEIKAVSWNFTPIGANYDYAAKVGDGLKSSVLVALLSWLMRTFPEAPAVVERHVQERWAIDFNHDLAAKIRQPNPYYSGRVLWMATVLEFAFGNAYWRIVRDNGGDVAELWWMPSALVRPIWDETRWPNTWIHHYEYKAGNVTEIISPDDVVHFRFGMDPMNPRMGFTPLAAMAREVYIDDQASNFTAAILKNLGIIGIIFSPATGAPGIPSGQLPQFVKYVEENFTGEKRGNALAFSQAMDAKVLAYNLQGFDMGPIRDIAEERLSAALGIPAAVVGFGTGLQQTKVGATMRELIGQAWNGCIMPMQAILAEELDRSLLPEFQKNTGLFRVQFDTSDVRALREDEKEKADRLGLLVEKGVIMVAEARQGLGFDVQDEHKVYYRPTSVVAVKSPGEKVEPPKPAVPKTAPAQELNDGQQQAA